MDNQTKKNLTIIHNERDLNTKKAQNAIASVQAQIAVLRTIDWTKADRLEAELTEACKA